MFGSPGNSEAAPALEMTVESLDTAPARQHHSSLCAAVQTIFAVRNSVSSAEAAPTVTMAVECVDRPLLCWQPLLRHARFV